MFKNSAHFFVASNIKFGFIMNCKKNILLALAWTTGRFLRWVHKHMTGTTIFDVRHRIRFNFEKVIAHFSHF